MSAFIIFVATLLTIVGSFLLNGFALSKLWAWFIVPLGAPSISISWAIGIAVIATTFFSTHESIKKHTDVDTVATTIQALLRPLIALLAGWIAHGFMN